MRKVIFKIDDVKFFIKSLKKQNPALTENQINELVSDMSPSFKATFILYGEGKSIDRYELIDSDGKQININDLNGYQKGCIINDCYAYFEGREYFDNTSSPCGVIEIIDTED